MTPFWINDDRFRVGVMPRPCGNDWLDDEAALLRRPGVDVIVSALTFEEADELGLKEEAEAARQSPSRFP